MTNLSASEIDLLNERFEKYNHLDFIEHDPISIPHRFKLKQDIEIAAFFAAILAWGQRKTIIAKCLELMHRMDNSPYEFVKNAQAQDLKSLEGFKHRTFNDFDLLLLVDFLKRNYQQKASLEDVFLVGNQPDENVKNNLIQFRKQIFGGHKEKIRTQKHIPSPETKSACKRLNMFLRWMVRRDNAGVDFGLWKRLSPKQLVIPCDVHVKNVAKRLNLTNRPSADWAMAEQITNNLKFLDAQDPSKYDFALFGMGIEKLPNSQFLASH